MSGHAANYTPPHVALLMRKQAIRVWWIGLTVLLAWILLIAAAPVAKAYSLALIASPLYQFFSFICHQIADRSFFIVGEQFAVCSRCFGVYFGLMIGFAVYPIWRSVDEIDPLPQFWLFAALIPIAIDWSLTVFGIWENTQISRFITGLILGTACGTYIVAAAVEITRNLTYRRRLVT